MRGVIPPFPPRRHGTVINSGQEKVHLYLLEEPNLQVSSRDNACDLQLGGGRLETRPGHIILTKVIVIFLNPTRDMP